MKDIYLSIYLSSLALSFLKTPKQKIKKQYKHFDYSPLQKCFCYFNVLFIVSLQIINTMSPAVENSLCYGFLYMGMTLIFITFMLRQEEIEII